MWCMVVLYPLESPFLHTSEIIMFTHHKQRTNNGLLDVHNSYTVGILFKFHKSGLRSVVADAGILLPSPL